ncbi:MAG TPA: arginine deiminase family protein [Pyrinomonadaceae bacterium]|nr:arginine deiminase family protein [Pyrinomonadaceae bacterium]
MLTAITREPARSLSGCELTYVARQPIDAGRAAAQHRDYRRALEACGARVVALPAVEGLPDSVFVEDAAVVLEELAVITSPGVASRRAEVGLINPEVARLRPVARILAPATLEGGDVLRVGRRLFVGLSPRTNRAGVEALERLTAPHGYEVAPIALRDCLHLKTACTAADDGTILLNPAWVDAEAFRGYELLAVHPAEPWAANTARVGESLLVGASFPRTAEALARRGLDVRPVDVSEFAKAEGGLTCMSLIFK